MSLILSLSAHKHRTQPPARCLFVFWTVLSSKCPRMIDSLYTATPQLQPTCAASGSIEDSRSVSDGSQIQLELDLADSRDCWTTLRRDLISNDNLARVGRGHGLHKCINMNGGTTRVSSGMVATAVEAILGAVEIYDCRDTLARVM
ncbi:hypothetical protein FOMG_09658 [Fusarium oxysporum f. sp. melonis 26406]|uniref:RNase III domain-containing protein n=1 Tax=Fusarium oxysporum f. sp. melonis 26406 TaxID=1089452 RepID=X0A6J6_FUSOX|nr:hypothetical protein FOMG_09658 [Fusarium oxysporum f. sp. melonis 26406]